MNKLINESIKEIQIARKISEEAYMLELDYRLQLAYVQGKIDVLKETIEGFTK